MIIMTNKVKCALYKYKCLYVFFNRDGIPPYKLGTKKQLQREMHRSVKINGQVTLPHFPVSPTTTTHWQTTESWFRAGVVLYFIVFYFLLFVVTQSYTDPLSCLFSN